MKDTSQFFFFNVQVNDFSKIKLPYGTTHFIKTMIISKIFPDTSQQLLTHKEHNYLSSRACQEKE